MTRKYKEIVENTKQINNTEKENAINTKDYIQTLSSKMLTYTNPTHEKNVFIKTNQEENIYKEENVKYENRYKEKSNNIGVNYNLSGLNKLSTNLTLDTNKKMYSPERVKITKKEECNTVSEKIMHSPDPHDKEKIELNLYSPINHHNPLNKSRNSMVSSMISLTNNFNNEVESNRFKTTLNFTGKNEGLKEFTNLKMKLKELETKISAMNNGIKYSNIDEKEKNVINSLKSYINETKSKLNTCKD